MHQTQNVFFLFVSKSSVLWSSVRFTVKPGLFHSHSAKGRDSLVISHDALGPSTSPTPPIISPLGQRRKTEERWSYKILNRFPTAASGPHRVCECECVCSASAYNENLCEANYFLQMWAQSQIRCDLFAAPLQTSGFNPPTLSNFGFSPPPDVPAVSITSKPAHVTPPPCIPAG